MHKPAHLTQRGLTLLLVFHHAHTLLLELAVLVIHVLQLVLRCGLPPCSRNITVRTAEAHKDKQDSKLSVTGMRLCVTMHAWWLCSPLFLCE